MQTEDRLYSKGLEEVTWSPFAPYASVGYAAGLLFSAHIAFFNLAVYRALPRINLNTASKMSLGSTNPLGGTISSLPFCAPQRLGAATGQGCTPCISMSLASSTEPGAQQLLKKCQTRPQPGSSQIALPTHMAKKTQSQLAGARARLFLSWGEGFCSLRRCPPCMHQASPTVRGMNAASPSPKAETKVNRG